MYSTAFSVEHRPIIISILHDYETQPLVEEVEIEDKSMQITWFCRLVLVLYVCYINLVVVDSIGIVWIQVSR